MSFFSSGYLKTQVNISDELKNLNYILHKNNKLHEKQADVPTFYYEINDEAKNIIKDIVNKKYKKIIENIEECMNLRVLISNVMISRNYHFNIDHRAETDSKNDKYSNFFHLDNNTCNFFKLLINLDEVGEDQGPTEFINVKDNQSFLSGARYISKNNYDTNFRDYIDKNIGKQGSSVFLSTPRSLHRASIPKKGNFRDMMYISFVATPYKKKFFDLFSLESFDSSFWSKFNTSKKRYTYLLSKPHTFKDTVSLFYELYKNKLN